MINADSAPVWVAAIGMLGGILTLIIQNIMSGHKLDTIHTLTNSSLSESKAREEKLAAVIVELRAGIANMMQQKAVEAATSKTQPMNNP